MANMSSCSPLQMWFILVQRSERRAVSRVDCPSLPVALLKLRHHCTPHIVHPTSYTPHRTPHIVHPTLYTPRCPCLPEKTLKVIGPFYLVSMPGEVRSHTRVNVAYCGHHLSNTSHDRSIDDAVQLILLATSQDGSME